MDANEFPPNNQTAIVKDFRHGRIRLQVVPLDAVMGKDGKWSGPGAEALNLNRRKSAARMLPWPQRLDRLKLTDCEIAVDADAYAKCLNPVAVRDPAYRVQEVKAVSRLLKAGKLEPVVPVRITAAPGARIRGRFLREICVVMRITAVLGVLLAVGGAGYWFWSKRKPVVPVRRAPLPTYAPMVTYQLPPGQTIPGPMVPAQSVNPFLPGYVAPPVAPNPFLGPNQLPSGIQPANPFLQSVVTPSYADVFFAWRPGTPPVRQAQIQQQFGLTPAPAEFPNLLSFRAPAPQGTSALYAALQAVPELQQMGVMEAAPV